MQTTILRIKNMVCPRCIKVVTEELNKLGYITTIERLGVVKIKHTKKLPNMKDITQALEEQGFELLVEKQSKVVESIKTVLIELIYQKKIKVPSINLADYLLQYFDCKYSYLSTSFSSVEGITIEKYFILQKIERVKELLIYNELTLSVIASQLGYSNVQYLSTQFKKVTGMSPSQFKVLRQRSRTSLDKIGKNSYTNK